jgi:hypothetical protein
MISELAMNEWTITTDTISKRVDRYETKAKWKRMYRNEVGPSQTRDGDVPLPANLNIPQDAPVSRMTNPSPRAYSVSITRSMSNALYSLDEERRPLMESPVSDSDESRLYR